MLSGYLFGLSLFVLSVGAFATSIFMLIMMCILQGIGWDFQQLSQDTITINLIPPKRRGEGMEYYGLSSYLALALGLALALSLVGSISFIRLFLIADLMGLSVLLL